MTSTDRVYAYNEISDVVRAVPRNHLNHPILGANMREVRNGKARGRLSEIITVPQAEDELDLPHTNEEVSEEPDSSPIDEKDD